MLSLQEPAPSDLAGDSFHTHLVDQLRKTPWLFLSVAFHFILLLWIWNQEFSTRPPQKETSIQSDLVIQEFVELRTVDPQIEDTPIEPEDVKPVDIDPSPDSPEDPVEPSDDHDPNPNNPSFDESLEFPTMIGLGGGNPLRHRDRGGAPPKANRAVTWGLQWLASAQSPDGRWDSDGYESNLDGPCPGRGHPYYDTGQTGLALLAFLGAGHTHLKRGPYRETVRKGLHYLESIQDPEGCFGDRISENFTYGHAIATLAMAEAHALSKSLICRSSAQRGINFIERARNPYGGWRYGIQSGESDISVTGWMVMALKSAKLANLRVDPAAFDGARAVVDRLTDESGSVGYTRRGTGPVRLPHLVEEFPARNSHSLTAVGMTTRVFLGVNPNGSEAIQKGADLLVGLLPEWNRPKIDMYYWYYGTLAMFQIGGKRWKKWNRAMLSTLTENQETEGVAKGSWPPVGAWGEEGGRIYSTALLTMCLEVYYRYGKVFGAERK